MSSVNDAADAATSLSTSTTIPTLAAAAGAAASQASPIWTMWTAIWQESDVTATKWMVRGMDADDQRGWHSYKCEIVTRNQGDGVEEVKEEVAWVATLFAQWY